MIGIHVIGAGGLAKELISYAIDERPARYEILGVWADDAFNNPRYARYYKGNIDDARRVLGKVDRAVLCIAAPKIKRNVLSKLGGPDAMDWITYIHPAATVSSFSSIGKGCVITPQCIVTSDAILEDFVFMNTGSVVGHDSRVGEFTTLFPNTEVCGDCVLGTDCVLGIGAFLVPGVQLQAGTRVRAGSIVWESQLESALLSGNPAVVVRR